MSHVGDVGLMTGRQTFGLNPAYVKADLNLFLLPDMDQQRDNTGMPISG